MIRDRELGIRFPFAVFLRQGFFYRGFAEVKQGDEQRLTGYQRSYAEEVSHG